jgi:hypothetical protein
MSIRWDAVVGSNAAGSCHTPPPSHRFAALAKEPGKIGVQVRIFGALAALSSEQDIECELSAGATLADVFALLGQRLGAEFLDHVVDRSGSKHRHCRLFVGGYPVEDLQTPLASTIDPSEIDIILLIAPEGG